MTAAHLYIAACLIVAGLDIYIGLKVYNMYFSQPEYLDEDTQEGDDQ
jgi:hypothetical protein